MKPIIHSKWAIHIWAIEGILYYEKNEENISKCRLLKFLPSMLTFKHIICTATGDNIILHILLLSKIIINKLYLETTNWSNFNIQLK